MREWLEAIAAIDGVRDWPGGNHNPKRKRGKKRGPSLTLRVMI